MVLMACLIVLVGFLWGGWPLMVKAAGNHGLMDLVTLTASATLTVAITALLSGDVALPPQPSMTWLGIAGVLVGTGLLAFSHVTTSPLMEASVSIPIMDVAMLIVTAAGGIYFFQESLTPQKMIGIALLVVGILFLRPTS